MFQYLPANLVPIYSNLLTTELGGSAKVRQRNPRNSRGTLPCQEPDCEKTFDSISALYFHAAAIHYKKPLQEMYGEEFKRVKGICTVCGSRLNSKQYYYIHMGSRHRVIQQLMDTETLIKYQSIGKWPAAAAGTTLKFAFNSFYFKLWYYLALIQHQPYRCLLWLRRQLLLLCPWNKWLFKIYFVVHRMGK